MNEEPDTITVYSDYVCPFCYLGKLSLDRYRRERSQPLEVDWRPYDLRMQKRRDDGGVDWSGDDGKDDEYYRQARENVLKLKQRYGADEMLDPDRVPDEVDSFAAQAASLYVERTHPELWREFDEAVFDAHWVEGRDIGDPDVLTTVADDVGLDPDEVRTAVDDENLRDDLRAKFTEAHRDGVTGVPTFVYGEHAARGAVPPEQLRRLVDGS